MRSQSPRSSVNALWRAGFTLLEVLVALGLSVVLVTAIYSAVSLYVELTLDDHSAIERSRVARAVFRQMAIDVQSVVFRLEDEEEESEEEDESAIPDPESIDDATINDFTNNPTGADLSGGESTVVVEVLNPEDAIVTSSVGLIGDAAKLTLHINRPPREASYQPVLLAGSTSARTSDLQSITYFLANPSSSGIEGVVGARAVQGKLGDVSGPQGLARLAGDQLAVQYADLEADEETLADSARIIAPEVVSLEFEYFDGLNWLTMWDSVAAQRLPNAISITIGLRRIVSDEERDAMQFEASDRASLDEILEHRRHVIALPLAEPYTEGL
jgi:prepilin-type N-terminal cleavage/methylation domain-containing protein